MDITKYYSRLERCSEQIRALEAEKLKIRSDYASELTAKYSEYVGKKVRIKHNPMYRNPVCVIGFFQGFVGGRYYPVMQVFKVRKDGTKSHNVFSSCELPAFDDVFTIEIVE